MTKKRIFELSIAVIILGLSVFFFAAILSNDSTHNRNSIDSVSAEMLIKDLKSEKSIYNGRFKDQVVDITGVISEINYKNGRYSILLQGGKENSSIVICDMQKDQIKKISVLKKGDTIVLKGVFKGFLKDAIFLNCIVSNNHQPND